jgi:hypothetical protein
MHRIWLPLLVTVLLAACGSAPQQGTRKPSSASTAANRTYKAPPGFPNFVDHSIGREEISIQAMALVGVPYRWGGNTPDAGFDCSGLVRYVVDRAASVQLPRTTAEMSGRGESIEPDEVAPGDLIFFNTTGRPHSHVGIYVGKLRFVNAPSTGGTVRLDYLTNPYWAKHFDGIRRVAQPKAAPTPFDAPTYLASPAPQGTAGAAGQSASTLAATPAPARAAVASSYARGSAPASPQANADAFEPPPSSLNAAQRQAQTAGTTAPAVASSYEPRPVAVAPSSANADAFEPPPSSLNAAQRQARTANASQPSAPTNADAFEPPPSSLSAAQRQARAANATAPSAATINASPDPIQAAADAFEPPPPSSRAAQQQARAARSTSEANDPPVRVMRASTSGITPPRPAASTDDPIASFAK